MLAMIQHSSGSVWTASLLPLSMIAAHWSLHKGQINFRAQKMSTVA
jgi:hypothetical protein